MLTGAATGELVANVCRCPRTMNGRNANVAKAMIPSDNTTMPITRTVSTSGELVGEGGGGNPRTESKTNSAFTA